MSRSFAQASILALLVLLALIPGVASAQAARPADEAFRLDVERGSDGGLVFGWTISPGHYLYRERIKAMTGAGNPLPLSLPPGEKKNDPLFGTTQIYSTQATAIMEGGALPPAGTIRLTYQGCAEHGVCYPPIVKQIDLATLAATSPKRDGALGIMPGNAGQTASNPRASDSGLAATIAGGVPTMLLSFLGFGLLLAFTPCVFPMVPILSGMLARSGQQLSARRGIALSGAYVLAMALAYAALGLAAAWSGRNLQVMLQTPAAIGLMSLVFVALSLSMFGLYDLALPAAWTARLSRATGRTGGSVGGAMLLGFGSALIVGPCVTPPLAAALLYVAQTGDVARGAAALFSLGIGMGVPLLVFGAFGGRLLPKSGDWLEGVKQVFGFVFLGLAVWMLGRVLPPAAATGLWAILAIAGGLWFGLLRSRGFGMRLAGSAIALGGVLLLASVAGLFSISCPWAACQGLPTSFQETENAFSRTVTTPEAFDAALAEARTKGQPILVDFTAKWCVTCREIDRNVMADPAIRPRLQNVSIIRADITADGPEGRKLMRRFGVMGPPTMLFLDARTGREIEHTRTVGAITAEQFAHTLGQAGV